MRVEYISKSNHYFTKGNTYDAKWDGDGYHEPTILIANDNFGNSHVIAYHDAEDPLFKTFFKEVK